jgi:uncharacterized membrane protein YphA (DoxX/SURF4 family)
MRSTLLAVAALAFLRIVLGLHFFLEGSSHLRDPDWSSAGFRRAAVGPFADFYRSALPQTGDWSGTLGAIDGRSLDEAAEAWRKSVVAGWEELLEARARSVPLDGETRAAADEALESAARELSRATRSIGEELEAYRLELARLDSWRRRPGANDIPFERQRVARRRSELEQEAAAWMADADAIGKRLVATWDAGLPSDMDRRRAAAAAPPTALWKADRFVSWALVTIGIGLVLGIFVKFHAIGGAIFLASVLVTQPFWVAGAQPTYNQWVEFAALLAIAAMPIGGWSGLDYFLTRFLANHGPSWCPLSAWCRRGTLTTG